MGIINEFRRNRQGHISATPPSEGGKTLEQQKILDLSYLVDMMGKVLENIKTEEGDVYGIYYSTWNRADEYSLPGVFGAGWITYKTNAYQPWKGNPALAKELSEKYFDQKQDLMIACARDDSLGKNCVAGDNNDGYVWRSIGADPRIRHRSIYLHNILI